jgi:hypothetical protein
MGGMGMGLPLLAFLGWKYRDRIKSAFNSRFGHAQSTAGAGTTSPGLGNL